MHHTKTKGDNGVAHAIADLSDRGFTVLLPITEHAPFDLVVYKDGVFRRVQVKYKSIRNGVINVDLRSVWSNRSGCHHKPANKNEIDVVCVYCPEVRKCFYFDPKKIGQSLFIRPDAFEQLAF